jgi:hypothetical protein|eukprot:SAG25_NODE_98_length_15733_cov_18.939237_16_plen_60_part_00
MYAQDPGCTWQGYDYYAGELRSRIEQGGYTSVLLLGDSMVITIASCVCALCYHSEAAEL